MEISFATCCQFVFSNAPRVVRERVQVQKNALKVAIDKTTVHFCKETIARLKDQKDDVNFILSSQNRMNNFFSR